MKKWWIGCSGFQYRHWKGVFYPEGVPQRKWFEYYCGHFNTLELNVTFYRTPRLSAFEGWYARSPEVFRFAVKAPRLITHYKKFNDTGALIRDFYGLVQEGLKEKLGCILFQLPPAYQYSGERLNMLCNSLDPAYKNVIEFRNESWWNAEVYQQLAFAGIGFCSVSHPALPEEVVYTSKILYERLHGKPQLYRSPYSKTDLFRLAAELSQPEQVNEVFVYFNNDIDASAILNAHQLQEIVGTL